MATRIGELEVSRSRELLDLLEWVDSVDASSSLCSRGSVTKALCEVAGVVVEEVELKVSPEFLPTESVELEVVERSVEGDPVELAEGLAKCR